jgi:hypothetical protein
MVKSGLGSFVSSVRENGRIHLIFWIHVVYIKGDSPVKFRDLTVSLRLATSSSL